MDRADGADRVSFEELLAAWGNDAVPGPPRPGSHRTDVRSVTVHGRPYVGRRTDRSEMSLDWEWTLLAHLERKGVPVPRPLPTVDGSLWHGGLMLTERLDGPHPETDADWLRVIAVLRAIHSHTRDWPQRPGVRPTDAEGIGDGWGVVVGRTRRRDITMTEAGPVFVDWDEARFGPQVLDFTSEGFPYELAGLTEADVQHWIRQWLKS